jgi:hypothetical protein
VEAAKLLQYGIGLRLDKKLLWALPQSRAFSNRGLVSVWHKTFALQRGTCGLEENNWRMNTGLHTPKEVNSGYEIIFFPWFRV